MSADFRPLSREDAPAFAALRRLVVEASPLGMGVTLASGNVATAGGCFASQYLAAWIIARSEGEEAARAALHHVAPVGEKEDYVSRAMRNVLPYLPVTAA